MHSIRSKLPVAKMPNHKINSIKNYEKLQVNHAPFLYVIMCPWKFESSSPQCKARICIWNAIEI